MENSGTQVSDRFRVSFRTCLDTMGKSPFFRPFGEQQVKTSPEQVSRISVSSRHIIFFLFGFNGVLFSCLESSMYVLTLATLVKVCSSMNVQYSVAIQKPNNYTVLLLFSILTTMKTTTIRFGSNNYTVLLLFSILTTMKTTTIRFGSLLLLAKQRQQPVNKNNNINNVNNNRSANNQIDYLVPCGRKVRFHISILF